MAESPQQKVVVCPLCARAVRYIPEQEAADAAVERHAAQGLCDASNYARVHQKVRCPVPGCREKLAGANSFTCKECAVTVCLKHRFGTDHACTGQPAAMQPTLAARQQLGNLLRAVRLGDSAPAEPSPAAQTLPAAPALQSRRQAFSRKARAGSGGKAGNSSSGGGGSGLFARAAAVLQGWRGMHPASATDPANSVRGSAVRRRQHAAGAPAQAAAAYPAPANAQRAAPVANPHPAAALTPVEVCADCGARFDTVGALIVHYEAVHAEAAAPSPDGITVGGDAHRGGD